jgi:hypothetical protein
MNAWVAAGSVAGLGLVAILVGDLVSGSFRGRLDRLSHRVLAVAVRRLDEDIRPDVAPEWAAELDAILGQHRAGPLPLIRLVIGTRFAFGLLRTARVTSGYLAAKPQLLDAGLRAAFQSTAPINPAQVVKGVAFQVLGGLTVPILGTIGLFLRAIGHFGLEKILFLIAGLFGLAVAWDLARFVWRERRERRGGRRPTGRRRRRRPARKRRPASAGGPGAVAAAGTDAQGSPGMAHADDTCADPTLLRPPTGPAIRHPATWDTYRRRQRWPHRLLAAGAAMVVVSVALAGILRVWSDSGSQRLYAAGKRIDGTVVDSDGRWNQQLFAPRVVFVYQVAGEPNPRRAAVRLGPDGRDYHPGERVSVVYDPADPARATIVGERNPPLWWPAGRQLGALGADILWFGVLYWLSGCRLRKSLTRAGWRPCRYRHVAIPGRTDERTLHVLALEHELADPEEPLLREVSPYAPASNHAWRPTGSVWVADDPRAPRRLIVGLPGESVMALYRVSRPRPDLRDRLLAAEPPPT